MRTKNWLSRQHGFSLVEIMVVLIIVGVLSTGAVVGVGEYRLIQKVKEGEQKIDNLREQLMLFGQVNRFLPCPDTDFDGFENRSGNACSNDVGTAPYVNLGLPREGVQDAWGSFIRYAVNRNVSDPDLICDKRSSASYFCNSGFGVNWFTFTETPPFYGTRGDGNYYVCNQNSGGCNGTTVASPANLESESASIVLVAYNKDGRQTLLNCAGNTGLNTENCDLDEFYHQGGVTSAEGLFFDDTVRFINGYEIKKAMLGNTIVWDDLSVTGIVPTYEDFDITASDTLADIETAGDDVVLVKRNVDTALDLGAGDDYISIGNDLEASASLATSGGNDTVYIVGQANSDVLLGAGDDVFVLVTDLTNTLDANSGNDKVWIQGGVASTATFTLGTGDDVFWLGQSSDTGSPLLDSNVNGGLGYDILVLESMTQSDWNAAPTAFKGFVVNFELVIFKADYSGARESLVL